MINLSNSTGRSGAATTSAVAAAAPPRVFSRASSPPAAAAGPECSASSVLPSPPAFVASTNPGGIASGGKSPSDLRSEFRLLAVSATTPPSGRIGGPGLPLSGPGLISPSTAAKQIASGSSVKIAASAAGVQQCWLGEFASSHANKRVSRGSGSSPTTSGGTRRSHAVSPATSTPVTGSATHSQEHGSLLAAAAASVSGDKDGARFKTFVQTSTGQLKQQQQQQDRGTVGVYAKREKIHNFTMHTLQQRKPVPVVMSTQRQLQRSLLQEQLPSFFPPEQEGEQSEDGKKLQRVLAFQKSAALTAAAAAASARNGEPLDWRTTTTAMVAFGLSQDVQKTLKDDDRWKRVFPRTRFAVKCPLPGDSQFLLFMALAAEGSRRYEEADAYVLRMLAANACRREETPAEQRLCMQKIINRRLRHQRNLWKQTVALERALQARQTEAEDTIASGARLEKTLQLDEVVSCKQRLKMEILRHCYGVIWTATHLLNPFAVSVAGRLFVHKTVAAAYRQATQYTTSISQFQCLELARENYEVAIKLVKSDDDLGPCDMTRLEVLISWANFLFYNLKKQELAVQEGRVTVQEALHGITMVKDDKNFKEVVEALQTLMRSIRRWMQETQKDAVFDWWMG